MTGAWWSSAHRCHDARDPTFRSVNDSALLRALPMGVVPRLRETMGGSPPLLL